jgi:hypothetical protein
MQAADPSPERLSLQAASALLQSPVPVPCASGGAEQAPFAVHFEAAPGDHVPGASVQVTFEDAGSAQQLQITLTQTATEGTVDATYSVSDATGVHTFAGTDAGVVVAPHTLVGYGAWFSRPTPVVAGPTAYTATFFSDDAGMLATYTSAAATAVWACTPTVAVTASHTDAWTVRNLNLHNNASFAPAALEHAFPLASAALVGDVATPDPAWPADACDVRGAPACAAGAIDEPACTAGSDACVFTAGTTIGLPQSATDMFSVSPIQCSGSAQVAIDITFDLVRDATVPGDVFEYWMQSTVVNQHYAFVRITVTGANSYSILTVNNNNPTEQSGSSTQNFSSWADGATKAVTFKIIIGGGGFVAQTSLSPECNACSQATNTDNGGIQCLSRVRMHAASSGDNTRWHLSNFRVSNSGQTILYQNVPLTSLAALNDVANNPSHSFGSAVGTPASWTVSSGASTCALPALCTAYTAQAPCEANTACDWTGAACAATASVCGALADSAACAGDAAHCAWRYAAPSEAVTAPGTCPASTCPASALGDTACNAQAGCAWDESRITGAYSFSDSGVYTMSPPPEQDLCLGTSKTYVYTFDMMSVGSWTGVTNFNWYDGSGNTMFRYVSVGSDDDFYGGMSQGGGNAPQYMQVGSDYTTDVWHQMEFVLQFDATTGSAVTELVYNGVSQFSATYDTVALNSGGCATEFQISDPGSRRIRNFRTYTDLAKTQLIHDLPLETVAGLTDLVGNAVPTVAEWTAAATGVQADALCADDCTGCPVTTCTTHGAQGVCEAEDGCEWTGSACQSFCVDAAYYPTIHPWVATDARADSPQEARGAHNRVLNLADFSLINWLLPAGAGHALGTCAAGAGSAFDYVRFELDAAAFQHAAGSNFDIYFREGAGGNYRVRWRLKFLNSDAPTSQVTNQSSFCQ